MQDHLWKSPRTTLRPSFVEWMPPPQCHSLVIFKAAFFETFLYPHLTEESTPKLVCPWSKPDDENALLIPKCLNILLKKPNVSGVNKHPGTCFCCQLAKIPVSVHNLNPVSWHELVVG